MALDAGSVAGDKAVVEFFVVGEIEALDLEFSFEAPISFGEKEEGGVAGLKRADCVEPETADSGWWMDRTEPWRCRHRWRAARWRVPSRSRSAGSAAG